MSDDKRMLCLCNSDTFYFSRSDDTVKIYSRFYSQNNRKVAALKPLFKDMSLEYLHEIWVDSFGYIEIYL